LVVFLFATYGEGEPTDNAIGLVDFLQSDVSEFSKGGSNLSNLNYLMFCLGNTTYEHFCATGRLIDQHLQNADATRIGPRGEGDDDKSLEEDYLAWKELIWNDLETNFEWREGEESSVPDFKLTELKNGSDEALVYKGELSKQALVGIRAIHDGRNPFISEIINIRELFQDGDRNCVSVEFDIKNSGMKYTTGDHLGIWPLNSNQEVDRLICILGLEWKRHQALEITSLDPTLAQVPTPSPTTYDSILRYYLDISQLASRQVIHSIAKFAPTEHARVLLENLGTDRDLYQTKVANQGLRLSEVLILATGDTLGNSKYTTWLIPFEHILSCIPRLQPRYYSISSSSRLYPDSIHVTVVVAKSKPSPTGRFIYGLNSNFILSLQTKITDLPRSKNIDSPQYALDGPRGSYIRNTSYCVPIHTRLSRFRLPKSVRVPLIMIGPGSVSDLITQKLAYLNYLKGVAPFRAFIQERVFLARRAKSRMGPDALNDWATMDLFYGCRRSDWDFLYKEEWESYERELDGKFKLHVGYSREPGKKKVYVQELVAENADRVVEALIQKKGYLYICGDAKHMAKDVEATLECIIGESVGSGRDLGAKEIRLLKERKRWMLDVWS